MSITLNVEPYCENCPHFDANVQKLYLLGEVMTQIECEHLLKCSAIKKYLQEEQKKNGKST